MNLRVTGIEVIELTDPKGLCNQPVPQIRGQPPIPAVPNPNTIPWQPTPQIPTTPYTGGPLPKHTGIWIKTLAHTTVPNFDPEYNEKWGLGLPQTQAPEPDKWEKNWQSKMSQSSEAQNEVEG